MRSWSKLLATYATSRTVSENYFPVGFSQRGNTHTGECKSRGKPQKIEVSFTISRDFPWSFKLPRAIFFPGRKPKDIIYEIFSYAVTQGAEIFIFNFCWIFWIKIRNIFASCIDALYQNRDFSYQIYITEYAYMHLF